MYDAKAYSVTSPTSPFGRTEIQRHDPTPHDVRDDDLTVELRGRIRPIRAPMTRWRPGVRGCRPLSLTEDAAEAELARPSPQRRRRIDPRRREATMGAWRSLWVLLAGVAWALPGAARPPATPPISTARVTILSTMLAEGMNEKTLLGEWGFSAVVEANGRRLLFDTGAAPETVLRNAEALGIDLSSITDVVLSHFHWDHTGGLVTLRRELSRKNPAALSRAHVGRGFFWPRTRDGKPFGSLTDVRTAYEASGGKFIEHDAPAEILPGVWLTGPVPRIHPERNHPPGILVETPRGTVPDEVPDDDSLVLDSTEGLIVVTGCGHAGVVNTLEAARKVVRPDAKVSTVFGGLHLFAADDATLDWTGAQLERFGVAHLVGAHCTGIEAVYRLRQSAGLDRKSCVVGAVGASYDMARGIDPRRLAR